MVAINAAVTDTAVNAGTCSEMDVSLSCVMLRGAQAAPKWQTVFLTLQAAKRRINPDAPNRR